MPRGRITTWAHEVPSESVPTLAKVLMPHAKQLLDFAKSFLIGPDGQGAFTKTEALVWVELLDDMVRLDPRGGYFAQNDVGQAFAQAVADKELREELDLQATACGKTADEVVAVVAFRVRELLTVLRSATRSQVL